MERTTVKTALVMAALAMVLAACGSGTASSAEEVATLEASGDAAGGAAPEGEEPVDREEALLAFAACMRDNGVEMADPTVDADGNVQLSRPGQAGEEGEEFDREAMEAARQACGEFLEGAQLGFEGTDIVELEDTMIEYAQCMRDNGYDMPDPDFSSFGPGAGGDGEPGQGGPFGALDRDDPDFIAAQETCEEILAGFGPGGGGFGRRQN